MPRTVQIYDTTLRDGCQAEDISLTLEDKLRITERLDEFGIVSSVVGMKPGPEAATTGRPTSTSSAHGARSEPKTPRGIGGDVNTPPVAKPKM